MARYYYDKYTVQTSTYYYNFRNARLAYTFQHSFSDLDGYSGWDFDSVNGFVMRGPLVSLAVNGFCFTGGETSVYYYSADGTAEYWTCDYSTDTSYSKGSYIETIIAEDNSYPDDGIQDGFWWVKRELAVTQIGTYKIQGSAGIIKLPIYDPALGMDGKSQLRIAIVNNIGCFELVDVNHPKASPLRIMTSTGIRAISK